MCGKIRLLAACSLIALTTASCATQNDKNAHGIPQEENGALETYNRGMFKFNYQVDKYVLKPVAKGYRAVTTPYVRERVNNALANIKEPISAFNHILQGEFRESGINLSRLVINTTLGLAGMYDVAGGWGLQQSKAGFDDTLAKWCIKAGPFIVLPLFGPATPRSTVGLIVDSVTNPVYLATLNAPSGTKDKISYGYTAVSVVAFRESALDLMDDLERNSVDFYTTMRSAFLQNRQNKGCFNDEGNASYDFDFGYEEEDQIFDEMESE